MSVKRYDPKDIIVTLAGAPMEGFAEGTFVNAERTNDSFQTVVGADGEGARAKSNDQSGTVTVTLMQTSLSNDILSAQLTLDELQGDGVFPLLIKDLNGLTIIAAESAYIQKPPAAGYGRELEDRVWVIATPKLEMFIGGAVAL